MTLRSFINSLSVLLLLIVTQGLLAEDAAPTERSKIEALISHIEGLEGARFIRNGSDYDPKTAAKFLRGKWQAHQKDITTTADFIAIAATRSSTSGKPYTIRLKDSSEVLSADHLTSQLKKLSATEDK